ncbi:hypothetical protein A2U01_0078854, partial [Trifolium medium]|nr:hypothetical protein [Trifolium medium]
WEVLVVTLTNSAPSGKLAGDRCCNIRIMDRC